MFVMIGLGRKKRRDDDWIEHQDTFDQILANLSAQSVASPKRTEDSSQNTKALLETATDSKRLLYDSALIKHISFINYFCIHILIQI